MSQEQELIELRNKAGIELAKVKRELMNSFSTNTPYVVECDGMFITPALEKGVMIGKPLMHAFPTEAMTFSMEDAEKVSVANEAGIKGKPILFRDALIKRGHKLSMIVNTIDAVSRFNVAESGLIFWVNSMEERLLIPTPTGGG